MVWEDKMENEMKSCGFFRKSLPWVVVFILMLSAFGGGMCCSHVTSMAREDRLEDVLDNIRENHVGSYDEDELYYGAIKGAVESLNDPFTSYLTPSEATAYFKRNKGEMVGIGIGYQIDQQKQFRIISVVVGGPADKAGLRSGDIILKVDGAELVGLDMQGFSDKVRGKENTQVKLTVQKVDSEQPAEVIIVRSKVIFPTVTCSIKNTSILYISVSHFNDAVMNGVYNCARQYVNENTVGIVLDLRNNPGGSLEASRKLASEWMTKSDMLVYTIKDRKGKDELGMSSEEHLFAGMKTVVLVNKGSASASEVVAGALQDYKLATIIGEKTYGKGVGQHLTVLSDGSLLILVSFKWYTPLGRNVHKIGLTPDIRISVDMDKVGWDTDPVLDKALEFLSK